MPQQIQDDTAALLAPMLKKMLFVAISRAVASAESIQPFISDNLRYMNALEARGALFASGPFVQPGVVVGDGLSILNTRDEAAAWRGWTMNHSSNAVYAPTICGNGNCARGGSPLRLSRSTFDLP